MFWKAADQQTPFVVDIDANQRKFVSGAGCAPTTRIATGPAATLPSMTSPNVTTVGHHCN